MFTYVCVCLCMLIAGVTLCRSWSPMDTRICPFGSSFRDFLACQRFPNVSRSWCRSRRNTTSVHMIAYDALKNVLMVLWCLTMILRSLPNFGRVWGLLNRVSIYSQLRHSVALALECVLVNVHAYFCQFMYFWVCMWMLGCVHIGSYVLGYGDGYSLCCVHASFCCCMFMCVHECLYLFMHVCFRPCTSRCVWVCSGLSVSIHICS